MVALRAYQDVKFSLYSLIVWGKCSVFPIRLFCLIRSIVEEALKVAD